MSQTKPIISIQGYRGSFHHIVAEQVWGKDVQLLERSSFKEVFADLSSGRSQYSICAVENTIAGPVSDTLDLLTSQDFYIIKEVVLRIKQNLIVMPGTKIEELERVYSHPVALQQCMKFFEQYPHITLISTDDTGKSVERMMRKKDPKAGSIASELAAELYGAEIAAEGIETTAENYTRFFVLAPKEPEKLVLTAPIKTSIVIRVKHEVGSLAQALSQLAALNFNLTKIESRPIAGMPWEYVMHIDMISSHSVEKINLLLGELKQHTKMLKILGCYQPATTQG